MPCRPSFVAVSLRMLVRILNFVKNFSNYGKKCAPIFCIALLSLPGEGRGSAGSPLVTMTPGHPRPDPQAPGNHITAGSCSQNWIEEFKMFFFPKLPGSEGWGGEGGWGGGQSNAVFKEDIQLFFW